MNIIFWRDVQNQDLTSYDALLEIMRRQIINKKLIDHQNRANKGLPPLQRNIEEDPPLTW